MTPHETARQRSARHRRDPLRKAQIAPRVIAPTRCACGHSKIMHGDAGCVSFDCDCTSYQEVSTATTERTGGQG